MKKLLISTFAAAVICCSALGQELKPGDLIWKFKAGNVVRTSPAIGADDTVYIGADKIYALNGKTGGNIWVFETGKLWNGTPSIGSDGTVYVSDENKVYALNPDRTKKWEFKVGEWIFFQPMHGSVAIGSNGIVYFGVGPGGDDKVYGLDGKTGDMKWESEILGAVMDSSPVIGLDDTIYVTFRTDPFFSLGQPMWTNNLCALDGNTGVKKWSFSIKKNSGSDGAFNSPAIGGDGTVYVGADKVYALDGKTGNKIRSLFTREWVSSPPAIGGDGIVYVGSWDKKVYAFDGKTGDKKWEFETGGFVTSSPAIGNDGTLYVGSDDKKVYAIKTSSTGPADSPWPMFGANAQRTGRAPARKAHEPIELKNLGMTAIPFSFTLSTTLGTTYEVQASHDLKKWGKLEEVKAISGEAKFTDLREAIFEKQYYRIKVVE